MTALLVGCSGDTAGPTGAATAFGQAVGSGDGSGACALLSPEVARDTADAARTDCARAILQEGLPGPAPVVGAEVFGHQAMVRTGSDSLFLSRFPDGWRVIAAGCASEGDRPYRCAVSGGG